MCMSIRIDYKISDKVHELAEKIAVSELDRNSDLEDLTNMYKNLMSAIYEGGVNKKAVSQFGRGIIIDKRTHLMSVGGDAISQATYDRIRGIYGNVSRELGFSVKDIELENDEVKPDYSKENADYIQLIEDTVWFLQKSAIPKLKNNPFTSLLKKPNNITLFFHDWAAQLKLAQSCFNHKEKVPVNTQHQLLHLIATMSTHNEAASEFFKLRVQNNNIIGKQMTKYRKGAVKNVPALYKPQNRDQAMMWNYLGVQCKCKSWRVIEYEGFQFKSNCLDCKLITTYEHPIKCNNCSIIFYDEDIKKLKKKCPQCKENFTPLTLKNIKFWEDNK